MPRRHRQPDIQTTDAIYWLTLAILVFAPLFRAGNRPMPLLILELAALGVLLVVLWDRHNRRAIPRSALWGAGALFLVPLLYLMPLPPALWTALPGREIYAEVMKAGDGAGPGWRPAAVIPMRAQIALLALLPPVAVFLAAIRLDPPRLQGLVLALFAIAAFQAALGLIQYGDGPGSVFYFGNPYAGGDANGTYPNRNHLAGLLEMTFPIALALTAATVGRHRTRGRGKWRERLTFLSTFSGHQAVVYGLLTLLFLVGIIFTRSRTGIALSMLGILLSVLAYSRRLGGTNVYGTAGTLAAAAIGIAAVIGLAPVLDRFSAIDTVEDARFTIFSSTLDGIGVFFPLGSGPGAFPDVYPRFQPLGLGAGHYINHAHNDYLEWLFEGGLLALAVFVFIMWFYLRQWPRVWIHGVWSTFRFIQVGAGIGIFLMLLHGLTDYNQRIPANMIFLALLAAVFLHAPEAEKAPATLRRKHGHRHHPPRPAPAAIQPPESPPRPVKNPFMD